MTDINSKWPQQDGGIPWLKYVKRLGTGLDFRYSWIHELKLPSGSHFSPSLASPSIVFTLLILLATEKVLGSSRRRGLSRPQAQQGWEPLSPFPGIGTSVGCTGRGPTTGWLLWSKPAGSRWPAWATYPLWDGKGELSPQGDGGADLGNKRRISSRGEGSKGFCADKMSYLLKRAPSSPSIDSLLRTLNSPTYNWQDPLP